jgi:hypothetical protein
MSSALKRVHSATGTVALVVALLALVASAAGVGYAAGTIGTDDLQNNAVTSQKIKNNAVTSKKVKKGSIKVSDLAPQERQIKAALGNGGEGDCIWMSGEVEVPGVGAPTYRLDRNNRVILSGIAASLSGPGGDTECDPTDPGQASDGIVFTLPKGYIPARTQYLIAMGGYTVIAGPQGFTAGALVLPPGTVFTIGDALFMDNLEFDPAGSKVVVAKGMKPSGRWTGPLL